MKLPLIPLDKANHFIYGFIIFVASNLLLNDLYSLGVVLLFAIGKEIKDQVVYKGFSIADVISTLTPGIVLCLTQFLNK